MTRLFATLIAVAALTVPASLFAADGYYGGSTRHHGYHHDDFGQGHWDHHPVHTPNLSRLDQFSDRLEKVAEHLHEDAHQLSQDYEHSASIEQYVDRLERLQRHMHDILHRRAQAGFSSYSAIRHIKEDVIETKALLNRLYGEIRHQGYDGARPNDFQLMAHMRRIIVNEAFPLVRAMESELYGFNRVIRTNHQSHQGPTVYPTQTYRQPKPTRSVGWRGFRFNF